MSRKEDFPMLIAKLVLGSKKEQPTIDLNEKVDEFINWYYTNMVKGRYTEFGEFHLPVKMRNLIEKIAVWYELRYPEYEINRLMYCCGREATNINDVMFKNNSYINDLLDENSDVKELDWDEFYNTDVFIKSLPLDERAFLSQPIYNSIAYLFPIEKAPFNLYLTATGFVERSENVSKWTNSIVKDEELIGLHVKQVVKLLEDRGINLPENSVLKEEIQFVDNQEYCKEGILDCAMYRIIERGGCRIGSRRAFLFAKEFGRNIDIPMMYGADCSDPGLRLFMNEYFKTGGSKDLVCYTNYFFRASKEEKVNTISMQELILKQCNNAIAFYTSEETKLHQRLVNALATAVEQKDKELKLKK